jgi:deoxyribose-phosphate aldolase
MKLEQYIENALLNPATNTEALITFLEEAKTHHFKGVCVNPVNVKKAKEVLKSTDLSVVTVIDFPFGANVTDVKVFAAKRAIDDGADEIDMVIALQALKDKNYDYVRVEI